MNVTLDDLGEAPDFLDGQRRGVHCMGRFLDGEDRPHDDDEDCFCHWPEWARVKVLAARLGVTEATVMQRYLQ